MWSAYWRGNAKISWSRTIPGRCSGSGADRERWPPRPRSWPKGLPRRAGSGASAASLNESESASAGVGGVPNSALNVQIFGSQHRVLSFQVSGVDSRPFFPSNFPKLELDIMSEAAFTSSEALSTFHAQHVIFRLNEIVLPPSYVKGLYFDSLETLSTVQTFNLTFNLTLDSGALVSSPRLINDPLLRFLFTLMP